MSYLAYKTVHLVGVFMVLLSIGALILLYAVKEERPALRKLAFATNGIGLLLALVAGFGLIAKLGLGFPIWVLIKILIWVAFLGLASMIKRQPGSAAAFWWTTLALASAAAYLALFKPF